MKSYKVVEWTDRQKVENFLLATDALEYLVKRAVAGAEHLELHEAETGCKYTLLFTYRKEN